MTQFHILTLFPESFPGTLASGVVGKALEKQLWSYKTIQIRDFAKDNYGTVDDTPYGGGAGMVMKPDIIADSIESIPEQQRGKMIYMSPRGTPLNSKLAKELANESNITILCGRYEGVDQRVLDSYNFHEVSIGDYVLSGGEIAAQVLIDATIRHVAGVLGNQETLSEESFDNGLLEYPHYTRPSNWLDKSGKEWQVPHTLLSGHHERIEQWRYNKALEITQKYRPDLIQKKHK